MPFYTGLPDLSCDITVEPYMAGYSRNSFSLIDNYFIPGNGSADSLLLMPYR